MNIGIIGPGPMALNLTIGWLKTGHQVVVGSRQPDARGGFSSQISGAKVVTVLEAIKSADVVVMATPFVAVAPLARQYAELLREKLVIDISNPYEHLPDNRISGAELTAQAIDNKPRVVAAFKTNTWETLLEPIDPNTGLQRDVFIAGDRIEDKKVVANLVEDLGFRAVDCGSLSRARILDGMVPLMTELDKQFTKGQHSLSWKLLGF